MTAEQWRDWYEHPWPGADAFIECVLRQLYGTSVVATDSEETTRDADLREACERLDITSMRHRATVELLDGPLYFYEVTLRPGCSLGCNVVAVSSLLNYAARESQALLAIHAERCSDQPWRLTYVPPHLPNLRCERKRLTYVVGPGQQCRSIGENFARLELQLGAGGLLRSRELMETFNQEALTDAFYAEINEWFLWASEDGGGVHFPAEESLTLRERAHCRVRLIVRVLFVWFLVKRNGLVPDCLFNKDILWSQLLRGHYQPDGLDFYWAILQNLFFATLNCPAAATDQLRPMRRFAKTERNRRETQNLYRYAALFRLEEDEVLRVFKDIPYLNGGLFDCLDHRKGLEFSSDMDHYTEERLLDGFSDNDRRDANGHHKYRAEVPNRYFFGCNEIVNVPGKKGGPSRSVTRHRLGLIEILRRYNFTVEESAPGEQLVSLVPDLLGNVFEQLYIVVDKDGATNGKSQKELGAYYTPSEVVDYMVGRALVAYLRAGWPSAPSEEDLHDLLRSGRAEGLTAAECEGVAERLTGITILDPACGSGAFTMGALQMLFRARLALNEAEEGHQLSALQRYDLKKEILERDIFGIDIEPIALMLCKLRFFIALICEPVSFASDKATLPNLETRFIAADTLRSSRLRELEADRDSWITDPGGAWRQRKTQLLAQRRQYFEAQGYTAKLRAREADRRLREELMSLCLGQSRKWREADFALYAEQERRERAQLTSLTPDWVELPDTGDIFSPSAAATRRVDRNADARKECQAAIASAVSRCRALRQELSDMQGALEQLTQWDPYESSTAAPFFDAEWMVCLDRPTQCFDIVLGNPPWGAALSPEQKTWCRKHYSVAQSASGGKGSLDSFALFIERAGQLLRPGGVQTQIVPMALVATDALEGAIKFLRNQYEEVYVASFAERPKQVFKNACIPSSIFLATKTKTRNGCHFYASKLNRRDDSESLQDVSRKASSTASLGRSTA